MDKTTDLVAREAKGTGDLGIAVLDKLLAETSEFTKWAADRIAAASPT